MVVVENEYNSINISGGQIVAGNIGGSGNRGRVEHPVVVHGADTATLAAALDQLRTELTRLRDTLPSTDGPQAQPDDVDEIIDTLESSEPDLQRATTRWSRLLARIPASLRSLDTVANIVKLMEQIKNLAL
ncbi:hypothetical protein AB0L63_10250 [Nocardia sp. NPDC051990]|uniref:hypothetical protein n=1 Tax=Nocardia sp. NPDC051990 TaxID=3155285 RepID=UPI0034219900